MGTLMVVIHERCGVPESGENACNASASFRPHLLPS
jgi:hypothetical protein